MPLMGSENLESDESRHKGKVVDPPQDAEKLGVKRKFVDPPQDLEKLGVSVRELLECPVCLNIMYPPIYQCCNGHPLCSNCKPKILDNHCPTCRQELGNIRCLTLVKVYMCLGRYFYMHMEKFQLGVVWLNIAFLQLMGDEEDAKTYRYILELIVTRGRLYGKECQEALEKATVKFVIV